MLQLTSHMRLLLAVDIADFRCGIDGLAALCRRRLKEDPFTGTVFVFTNRRKNAVKVLIYDGTGFWLCAKRFSRGKLAWWPTHHNTTHVLKVSELQLLLQQNNPRHIDITPDWRTISPTPSNAPKSEPL